MVPLTQQGAAGKEAFPAQPQICVWIGLRLGAAYGGDQPHRPAIL